MKKNSFLFLCSVMLFCPLLSACQTDSVKPKTEPAPASVDENHVLLSPQALRDHPMETVRVEKKIVSSELKTVGEIKVDQNRVFHISSITPGRIVSDRANLGQLVHSGQLMAVIQNPDLIKIESTALHDLNTNEISLEQTKTRLMLAKENLAREDRLYKAGITAKKEWIAANANVKILQSELKGLNEHRQHIHAETRAMLQSYGVSYSAASRLKGGSQLVAPKSGVVTQKNVTLGDTVSSGQVLYELADLSQVWLDITVYPKDVNRIQPGYEVRFQSDSHPGFTVRGKIDYVRPDANLKSQTFTARAFLLNPGYQLKPGLFGQVSVTHQSLNRYLPFIPGTALQSYGKESFVFIPDGEKGYRKQVVQIASHTTDGVFIESGLEIGQTIVREGSFVLKSELLKNRQRSDEMDEE